MQGADDDPTLRAAVPPKAPAPSRETARLQWQFRWQYVGAQEGIRGHAERTKAAQFLERPASCTRFRTFPSWTSPVRPRSPALEKAPTSHGLPRFSVRSPVGEPA